MRYLVLATDYDGTIAKYGHVDDATWAAIRRLRESGRRIVLVTGRELEDLQTVCPHVDLFDRVVAENGALIYQPSTKEIRLLVEPPPPEFVSRLKGEKVTPLSVGRVIVATVKPHETAVLKAISELGLELQVIFNQEAVMVLPSGVNKATGLTAALKELGLSPHNAVSVGDAENDHALLSACECAAAVGDAVPALRSRADWVARGSAGDSVVELIDRLLADDLASVGEHLTRHNILVGRGPDGDEKIEPYGKNILVTGSSGSGKAVVTAGFLERLADAKYQFAVIDPEGDFAAMAGVVVLGSTDRPVSADETVNLLASGRNAVINLVGIPHAERPAFFNQLLPRLNDLQTRKGRPHWLVVSKAHQLVPATWTPLTPRVRNWLLVTVHPANVARRVLDSVDLVLAMGEQPEKTLAAFCEARRAACPNAPPTTLGDGEALTYWVESGRPPFKLTAGTGRVEKQLQRKRSAEGRLPDDRTFVFRGPAGKLHLKAYNLMTFLELAAGVDDATWLYHLKAGEYSKWLRDAIKDEDLARDVAEAEKKFIKDPAAGREAVRKAIESRYALPAPVHRRHRGRWRRLFSRQRLDVLQVPQPEAAAEGRQVVAQP
jgi:HAD superfamily hydrolase (TIGR01484 family)